MIGKLMRGLINSITGYSKLFKEIEKNGGQWEATIKNHQENEKKLSDKQLRKFGINLYRNKLTKFVDDFKLSNEEIKELESILTFFNLSYEIATKIKRQLAPKTLDAMSRLKLSDKILTDDEKDEMRDLAKELCVPYSDVEVINKNNAIKIYMKALNEAKADRRITAEEEQELKALCINMGLSPDDISQALSKSAKQEIAYFKLLAEVENGYMPEISSPIPITQNEKCHLAINATMLESKIVTVGFAGGSRGVSIRLAKGLSYRVGNFRGGPIKQQVDYRYPGKLVVTSKKIVFSASGKGFSMPLNKLSGLEPYSDGIGLQQGSKFYVLQFPGRQTELVAMIITAAVNKY